VAESLAQSASRGSVRAIELHDGEASINKLAAEPSTEGAGAFHGKQGGVAELLGPGDQLVIPLAGGGDPTFAQPAAVGGKGDRHMDVFVGVDADPVSISVVVAPACSG
jgi:hypothetical protein